MEPFDYLSLQESFGGKFVALRDQEVIAAADSHGELVRQLQEKKLSLEEIVFEYVRPKGRVCAY